MFEFDCVSILIRYLNLNNSLSCWQKKKCSRFALQVNRSKMLANNARWLVFHDPQGSDPVTPRYAHKSGKKIEPDCPLAVILQPESRRLVLFESNTACLLEVTANAEPISHDLLAREAIDDLARRRRLAALKFGRPDLADSLRRIVPARIAQLGRWVVAQVLVNAVHVHVLSAPVVDLVTGGKIGLDLTSIGTCWHGKFDQHVDFVGCAGLLADPESGQVGFHR